jgi:prepilin-type N-terminal cleavage/methylation domain-containing protein
MTLVELLVVLLIIGVLAAIAIPSFFSQSTKAGDASAKVSARTAAGAIEVYATDHDGSYAGATPAALHTIEATIDPAKVSVSDSDGNGIPGDRTYRVTATSATGNDFWLARDSSGVTTLGCRVAGRAGCPSNGRWG